MGSRSKYLTPEASQRGAAVGVFGHRNRRRRVLPLFAILAAAGSFFVLALVPHQPPSAQADVLMTSVVAGKTQTLEVKDTVAAMAVVRDSYKVTPKPVIIVRAAASASAPAVGTPDPGSAQAIGKELVTARGWGDDQFACLVSLFNRESHWNVYAANPSGAYGIPQALPGSKMASAGADWQTSARTQITWGLNYIAGRYLTPCGAWGHSQSVGWY
ncbi:hypothetical protein BH09ACT1_BH09ACT1_28520 [soil metagenome]